jgi:Questin oxidase-like
MENVSVACSELLIEARRFGPLYGDRLASHLPMALIAMDRMGANAAAMQSFFVDYSSKLERRAGGRGGAVIAVDPRQCLGSGNDFEGLVAYYVNALRSDGVQSVLRAWLPLLMPGMAASAFHCLIRLAYAIDAGDESEICFALAYWAMEYMPLPLTMRPVAATADEVAAQLSEGIGQHVFSPGIIVDKMLEIARHPAVSGAPLQPAELSLRDIAQFSLSAYARHDDFTLLHTVTACHAFRLILPYAGDEQLAIRYLWQAVLVAYLSADRSAGAADSSLADITAPSWDDCFRACLLSRDDHVLKLCYCACCEYQQYEDERYAAIAWRKIIGPG